MDYSQLAKLSPWDYLDPWRFVTGFDSKNPEQLQSQLEKGIETGKEYPDIYISDWSVWSASHGERSPACFSYEGIGYHSYTAPLLRGFLMSPAAVWVHRQGQEKTLIKPSGYWLDASERGYSVGLKGDTSALLVTMDRNEVINFFEEVQRKT